MYALLIVSFVTISLFQILRIIFGTDFLSFGIFTSPTSNLVGKWNDIALFAGMISILLMTTLQLVSLKKIQRIILYILLILSIFIIAIVNFSFVWILMALFAITILVYSSAFSSSISGGSVFVPKFKKISLIPLIVTLVSIAFIIVPVLGNSFSSLSKVKNIEVRPSWGLTIDIAQNTFEDDLILGAGPNRFSNQWSLFKPVEINNTIFWNTDFNFGIGMIPTFALNTGLLGILAWSIFLLSFLYLGIRSICTLKENTNNNYLIISIFLLSLYSWIVTFFYVPNIVGFVYSFFLTGVFIAVATRMGIIKNYSFSFLNDPRISFVSVLALILLIIATISGVYMFAERYFATHKFSNGITAFGVGNVEEAELNISRAADMIKSDEYYRALSEIKIQKIGQVITQKENVGQDVIRAQFQSALGDAISSARNAVEIDKTDYLNWLSLGKVYDAIVPLGIDGAYENAFSAYMNAVSLNPNSPFLQLTLARLELAKQNTSKAREYINKAIELKQNYTNAIFLLAQLDINEGDIDSAIKSVEKASLIAPNDTGVFFQLGFLKYKNKDYDGAISALERSVKLNPVYANAKYFLGLAYDKLGRKKDAIAQFKDVQLLNPDNDEVKNILENLNAGRGALESVASTAPEDREEPPIEE